MALSAVLAQHIRQAYTGGNWTSVNMTETLADVDFDLASEQRLGFNSIARLVVHMDYYVDVILRALQHGELMGKDADSWVMPLPTNAAAWEALKAEVLAKAETFAAYVETLEQERLDGPFVDGKYGTVLKQILGFVEHFHYHLGQITILKKMLRKDAAV